MKKGKNNATKVLDTKVENNAKATKVEEIVANVETPKVEIEAAAETPRLGRPIDPNSPRQIKLKEDAAKREAGLLKRGRKPVEGSANQIKMAERAARIAAGGSVERGRPIVADSPRQIRLAKMKAKAEAGIAIKPGRPSFEMVEKINAIVEPVITEIKGEIVETEKA